jgi:anti-sigma factor RsiW
MTDHLSPPILSALVDGELSPDQLATTSQHLAECALCTSNALYESLLKSATANAGRRYAPPSNLRERILSQIRQDVSQREPSYRGIAPLARRGFVFYGWATAAALLLFCVGVVVIHQRAEIRSARVASENLALANEAFDQHIATLAANALPQVISSDRHTVKPWFQGKLPFSFNLPENLPSGTTLDGANLTYISNRPSAQLLYSIGKHRASIYLEQGVNSNDSITPLADHSGFHVIRFSTPEITGVAVSDVDPSRLSDLVRLIVQAQSK